jgi:hypothetical protein
MIRVAIAGFLLSAVLTAAEDAKPPIAGNPVVNLSGRITKVDAFRPGSGMPALVMDVDGAATTVILGSMRYLMQQNFNPKAGAEVQVKGYKLPASVVAIEVRLPADGTTLRLRDEKGWPVWRGGGCRNCGTRR